MARSITYAEFEELYQAHASAIFGHIRALVSNAQDAEEVFQETATILCTKYDQYQPNTDFRAWACRIAYYEVLKYRERASRQPNVLSNEVLDLVDSEMIVMSDALDARGEALARCSELLKTKDPELIKDYYSREIAVAELAARMRKSVDTVYRSLRRVHTQLLECVEKRLEALDQ